ncbi:tail fiber domain-containing protein, partial [Salmonella enterica]|nr:tail fiber domain-containing protein [Salmonella enterica]
DAKYLQVENNLSDVKDVATARTNLGINSTIENDAKYLQVSNNLSDVSDAAAARTNISVYSKAESDATYVPKTTTVNGHALDSNVTVSKADVGLGSVTDDPQLKISANLSDLSNVAKARTNLGINSTIENDAKYLQVSNNLSDVADVDTVKQNIGLDRFKQSPSETMIYPSSGQNPYRITIRPNGDWGTWRDDTGTWEPLKIVAGGTGATNKKDARLNLNIPAAYKIIPDGTNILGWFIENNESGFFSSGENVINKPADGHGWWTYNFKIHLRNQEGKPEFGVVEATSAANIMYIIVLTNGQWPYGWFKIVRENDNVQLRDLKLTQYDTGFSGHLELYNIQNNNPKGLTQLYNEFQDGVLKTTLRTGNLENNRNSYLQWDENGSLWGVVNILSNDLYFGPHSVRKLHTRHGTMLVDGTATPYYYTFGNPDGRRSVTEFGTVEDGWIFYGQVNRDLSKQLDVNGVVNASAFNQASDRDLKEN